MLIILENLAKITAKKALDRMNEYNFICEKQKFLGNEFDSSELSGSELFTENF